MNSSQISHGDNVVSLLLASADQSWETLRDIERIRITLCIDPDIMDEYLDKFESSIDPKTLSFMLDSGRTILETLQTSDDELNEGDIVLDNLNDLGYTSRPLNGVETLRMSARIIIKPWLMYLVYTDPGI